MVRRLAFGMAMIGVMLASGGCLLQGNNSGSEPTARPQQLPTNTPIPTITPTSGPTQEPETIEVIITATPDPAAMAQMTAVAQLSDSDLTDQAVIQGVTLTIAAATQIFLDQTATADADFIIPTATFTLDPTFAVPTATATLAGSVGGAGDCEHIVSAGQNLFRIGLQYNVGYQTIANYNGIANANLITIGQRLLIPNCGLGGTGSTESGSFDGGTGSTGGSTGGSVDPSLGSTCGSQVIVDQGDTLFAISLRCNVLIRQIMSLNGISNPDLIYFNQTLRLQ